MNLKEIAEIIEASTLVEDADEGADAPVEIRQCYAADLMSDVLAFCPPDAMLVTALTNAQVVRTADVADVKVVVFVQAKRPDHETVVLARARELPLLTTRLSTFDVCVRLHEAGFRNPDA